MNSVHLKEVQGSVPQSNVENLGNKGNLQGSQVQNARGEQRVSAQQDRPVRQSLSKLISNYFKARSEQSKQAAVNKAVTKLANAVDKPSIPPSKVATLVANLRNAATKVNPGNPEKALHDTFAKLSKGLPDQIAKVLSRPGMDEAVMKVIDHRQAMNKQLAGNLVNAGFGSPQDVPTSRSNRRELQAFRSFLTELQPARKQAEVREQMHGLMEKHNVTPGTILFLAKDGDRSLAGEELGKKLFGDDWSAFKDLTVQSGTTTKLENAEAKNIQRLWVEVNVQSDGKLKDAVMQDWSTHLDDLLAGTMAGGVGAGTVLRANGSETAFLAAIQKTFDSGYTESMLKDAMVMANNVGNVSLKSDDGGELTPKELSHRQNQVLGIYHNTVNKITASGDTVPMEICQACAQVYKAVFKASGDAQIAQNAVAGTIILRLLNPALVAPGSSAPTPGSLPLPEEGGRDAMMLLSKILQNQGNSKMTFEGKELKGFEPTLTEWAPKMNEFLSTIVERGLGIDKGTLPLENTMVGVEQSLQEFDEWTKQNDLSVEGGSGSEAKIEPESPRFVDEELEKTFRSSPSPARESKETSNAREWRGVSEFFLR